MCETRPHDPDDASKGQFVVSDCMSCNCPTRTSTYSGQHNYYNGECLKCGKKE